MDIINIETIECLITHATIDYISISQEKLICTLKNYYKKQKLWKLQKKKKILLHPTVYSLLFSPRQVSRDDLHELCTLERKKAILRKNELFRTDRAINCPALSPSKASRAAHYMYIHTYTLRRP